MSYDNKIIKTFLYCDSKLIQIDFRQQYISIILSCYDSTKEFEKILEIHPEKEIKRIWIEDLRKGFEKHFEIFKLIEKFCQENDLDRSEFFTDHLKAHLVHIYSKLSNILRKQFITISTELLSVFPEKSTHSFSSLSSWAASLKSSVSSSDNIPINSSPETDYVSFLEIPCTFFITGKLSSENIQELQFDIRSHSTSQTNGEGYDNQENNTSKKSDELKEKVQNTLNLQTIIKILFDIRVFRTNFKVEKQYEEEPTIIQEYLFLTLNSFVNNLRSSSSSLFSNSSFQIEKFEKYITFLSSDSTKIWLSILFLFKKSYLRKSNSTHSITSILWNSNSSLSNKDKIHFNNNNNNNNDFDLFTNERRRRIIQKQTNRAKWKECIEQSPIHKILFGENEINIKQKQIFQEIQKQSDQFINEIDQSLFSILQKSLSLPSSTSSLSLSSLLSSSSQKGNTNETRKLQSRLKLIGKVMRVLYYFFFQGTGVMYLPFILFLKNNTQIQLNESQEDMVVLWFRCIVNRCSIFKSLYDEFISLIKLFKKTDYSSFFGSTLWSSDSVDQKLSSLTTMIESLSLFLPFMSQTSLRNSSQNNLQKSNTNETIAQPNGASPQILNNSFEEQGERKKKSLLSSSRKWPEIDGKRTQEQVTNNSQKQNEIEIKDEETFYEFFEELLSPPQDQIPIIRAFQQEFKRSLNQEQSEFIVKNNVVSGKVAFLYQSYSPKIFGLIINSSNKSNSLSSSLSSSKINFTNSKQKMISIV